MSVSTYDFNLNKQVIFNYKETDLPEGHFLHKFLVEFQIEKFEIIETRSTNFNLEIAKSEQKVVIHDMIKDEFYKILEGSHDLFFELSRRSPDICASCFHDFCADRQTRMRALDRRKNHESLMGIYSVNDSSISCLKIIWILARIEIHSSSHSSTS